MTATPEHILGGDAGLAITLSLRNPIMSLNRLIYSSIASPELSWRHVISILESASVRNATLNITGMLIMCDGWFLQALEGESQAVSLVYIMVLPVMRGMKTCKC